MMYLGTLNKVDFFLLDDPEKDEDSERQRPMMRKRAQEAQRVCIASKIVKNDEDMFDLCMNLHW